MIFFVFCKQYLIIDLFIIGGSDKEHGDIERERELYEREFHQQHPSPPHQQQQQQQQPQQIHMTSASHPHLRHIGLSPSSIICIQSPHPHSQQQQQQSSNNSSQNPVQNSSQVHTTSASQHQHQVQSNEQQMHEHQLHHMKKEQIPSMGTSQQHQNHLVQNSSHYTHTSHHQHQQNGESRPSVIESSQPMIIECT